MSWDFASSRDLRGIITFLKCDEWQKIQSMSLLIKKGKFHYPSKNEALFLINKNSEVVTGLISISNRGLIFPHFSKETIVSQKEREELIKLMARININIHGVIGLKRDVDYFDKIIFKPLRAINNYIILHRDSTEDMTSPTIVKKAKLRDYSRLLPLEIEYQREEVIISQKDLNRGVIALNFKNKLLNDDIYYIEEKRQIVSKGGTTYKSQNYTLLGGIFTWKRVRNRGLSTKLLSHLINDQIKKGYKSALFVKKENEPALHLYKKLGFIEPMEYSINYYKR